MSATLTWASSGNITKGGTAIGNLLDDLDTMITSKSGDATFFWQKAGKNSATTPFYLLLSPKDGSNRRIAIIDWSTTPAAINPAILDTGPVLNQAYICYFPNGSANTLSNLTSSSGTVCGNDTGAIKCQSWGSVAGIYSTSQQAFYFDSAEAMWFLTGNPAAAPNASCCAAGSIIVDASDVAYDACYGCAGGPYSFGASSAPMGWTATASNNAGNASQGASVRTNYGAANRNYYQAWVMSATWGAQAIGANDILTDTSNTKAWFVPIQLLGLTKGEGFVLKFRQFGMGPAVTGPFTIYNTTGPVVAARSMINTTAGSSAGFPWLTNFKI